MADISGLNKKNIIILRKQHVYLYVYKYIKAYIYASK